ncbi:MAG: hypothetical protein M0T74_16625 [Desulfitobacterium hafniense]|nr:hypothetical protein [Desulfitobacterium hafniense]
MSSYSWIILSYKVPSEPSTFRVRVWRNLKELGVLYLQQSVCVVPNTPEVAKKIQHVLKVVEESQGEGLLLEVKHFSDESETKLIDTFNQQCIEEWREFLQGCERFLQEIELETKTENFTFYEVEENEADLLKLRRWFRKIFKRDFFSSTMLAEAQKQMSNCEKILKTFTKEVYQRQGFAEGQIIRDTLD